MYINHPPWAIDAAEQFEFTIRSWSCIPARVRLIWGQRCEIEWEKQLDDAGVLVGTLHLLEARYRRDFLVSILPGEQLRIRVVSSLRAPLELPIDQMLLANLLVLTCSAGVALFPRFYVDDPSRLCIFGVSIETPLSAFDSVVLDNALHRLSAAADMVATCCRFMQDIANQGQKL